MPPHSLPVSATREVIQKGRVWRVYEFTWQMDAIPFWDRFEDRWLRGSAFHYPERPISLPSLKPLANWPKFNPRDVRQADGAELAGNPWPLNAFLYLVGILNALSVGSPHG